MTGKGDSNRTTDHAAYRQNHTRIFNRPDCCGTTCTCKKPCGHKTECKATKEYREEAKKSDS